MFVGVFRVSGLGCNSFQRWGFRLYNQVVLLALLSKPSAEGEPGSRDSSPDEVSRNSTVETTLFPLWLGNLDFEGFRIRAMYHLGFTMLSAAVSA